jgi:hypothetical protein
MRKYQFLVHKVKYKYRDKTHKHFIINNHDLTVEVTQGIEY